MLLAKILVTTSVAFFSIVSAANTWNITVDEFKFGNSSISGVQPGDTLRFIFANIGKERSVTESTLDKPCSHKDGGIDTGLVRSPHIYPLKVNDSNPIWFYSRTTLGYNICKEYGMFFAVNPTPEQLKTFKRNAIHSSSGCSGVKIPIQKMIVGVALFAGLLAV